VAVAFLVLPNDAARTGDGTGNRSKRKSLVLSAPLKLPHKKIDNFITSGFNNHVARLSACGARTTLFPD
jgi:hypothetical protein